MRKRLPVGAGGSIAVTAPPADGYSVVEPVWADR